MTSKTIVTLFAAAVVGVTLLAGPEHGSLEQPKPGAREEVPIAPSKGEPVSEDETMDTKAFIDELETAIETLEEFQPSGRTQKKSAAKDNSPVAK